MSGEVVNLRRARKARARAEGEAHAAANRAHFGRTRNERAASDQTAERLRRTVEGARLVRDEDPLA